MAGRERAILLGGAVVVVLGLGFVLVVDPWLERLDRLDRQIARAQHHQKELRTLATQVTALQGRLGAVERKMEAAQGQFALLPFLEEASKATRVRERVTAMQPQATTPTQGFKETAVEVRLEGVQLPELLALLVKLEDSSYPVQVKRVQLRPRFDSPHLLEATVLVSTHEKT